MDCNIVPLAKGKMNEPIRQSCCNKNKYRKGKLILFLTGKIHLFLMEDACIIM